MFFEFEPTSNSNVNNTKTGQQSSKSSTSSLPSISETAVTRNAVSAIKSGSPGQRPKSGHSYMHHCSPSKSPCPLSPLTIDSSSASPSSLSSNQASQPQSTRQRRYSMHSCHAPHQPQTLTLETLKENNISSYCDLALITKKKLMLLNGGTGCTSGISSFSSTGLPNSTVSKVKSDECGFIEPDAKLNPTFTKHSNNDLRKEVLLASIQRTLSASTEDLSQLSNNSDNVIDSVVPMDTMLSQSNNIRSNSITCTDDSISMDFSFESNKRNLESLKARPSYKHRHSLSYMPSETQVNLNSMTTFTSTMSVAGGNKNQNHSSLVNNCRNYIKSLNMNPHHHGSSDSGPLLVAASANYPSGGQYQYYSHRTCLQSPSGQTTQTVQSSPIRASLKKRLYSTSPSKYSSPPYHTCAQPLQIDSIIHSSSINNNSNTIYSNTNSANSGNMSPNWESAFKRLKVMHNNSNNNEELNLNNNSQEENNSQQQPVKELNELAQDFHRLKTPFT